jgi:hypothetical protein
MFTILSHTENANQLLQLKFVILATQEVEIGRIEV